MVMEARRSRRGAALLASIDGVSQSPSRIRNRTALEAPRRGGSSAAEANAAPRYVMCTVRQLEAYRSSRKPEATSHGRKATLMTSVGRSSHREHLGTGSASDADLSQAGPLLEATAPTDQPTSAQEPEALVILTGRDVLSARQARRLLRGITRGGRTHATGFRSVFRLEVPGDPQDVARRISADVGEHFGHITAVLHEVDSRVEAIRDAAVQVGQEEIGPDQTFCFRLHKRGSHWIGPDSRATEREIGGAVADSIRAATGRHPEVDLDGPDVTIVAEVIGPTTYVGVHRSAWTSRRLGA
jgi:tRNA(Ser,Leu) C12 N-acetylase TAN1